LPQFDHSAGEPVQGRGRTDKEGAIGVRPCWQWLKRLPVLALIVGLFATAPVVANPASSGDSPELAPSDAETETFRAELARRQSALDDIRSQLDELDRQLAIAAEAYNRAAVELEQTRELLESTRVDLANAEVAYQLQQDTLADRARDLYRDGDMHALELVVGSKSVSDLVARVRFMHAMGESDAELAAALKAQRDQIAQKAAELEAAERAAAALEFEMKARKVEVELRIQEREQLLAEAQSDLLELLEQEAARRQIEEAALLADVLSGASKAGIIVEPGSPVETALAYHGVPYLWGGASPAGFDCSGLVMHVFAQHGVKLPHYSGAQFQLGEKVPPGDLRPGDVVFFGSPVYHVGMYVGAGYFIHAPRTGDYVKLSKLADRTDYAGARRYNWQYRTAPIKGAVTDPASAVR
jgi:cell wall-associated NlpC family hydrolase